MPPQIRFTNLCGIDQGFLSGRNVGGCHCDVGHGRAYDPVRDFWTQEVDPSIARTYTPRPVGTGGLWELGELSELGEETGPPALGLGTTDMLEHPPHLLSDRVCHCIGIALY